jgi:hypothetical protein
MSKSKKSSWCVDAIRNQPVAKFMYKGSHSKPVRRTVVITELGRNTIGGYEVREGRTTRVLANAGYKTFSRDEIVNMSRHPITVSF